MRLPRLRFTLGRMMIGVAVLALILWGVNAWRVRSDYLLLAAKCAMSEDTHRAEQRMWEKQAARLGPDHVVTKHSLSQAAWAAEVVRQKVALRLLYEAKARQPWRYSNAVPAPYTSP